MIQTTAIAEHADSTDDVLNTEGKHNCTVSQQLRLGRFDNATSTEKKPTLEIGETNLKGGVYIYRVLIENDLKHTGKLVDVK